jgi:hypothetical protein
MGAKSPTGRVRPERKEKLENGNRGWVGYRRGTAGICLLDDAADDGALVYAEVLAVDLGLGSLGGDAGDADLAD